MPAKPLPKKLPGLQASPAKVTPRQLKFDNDAAEVAEAGLGGFGGGEAVAETGVDVVHLRGADGDVFFERYVHAAAEDPGEGVVVGLFAEVDAAALVVAGVVDFRVAAIVRAAEHDLHERPGEFHMEAHDGAGGVGEGIGFDGERTRGESAARSTAGGHGEIEGVGAVILKIRFDADVLVEEIGDGSAAAVQRKVRDVSVVRRPKVGIVNGELERRGVLRVKDWCEENDDR